MTSIGAASLVTLDVAAVGRFGSSVWVGIADDREDLSLRSAVVAFPPESREQLTVWTVIAPNGDPLETIASEGAEDVVGYVRSASASAIYVSPAGQDPFVVSAWPTDEPFVFHIVATVPVTDKRWRRVERKLRAVAPQVSAFFLDRSDFEEIVYLLGVFGDVCTSRLTARRRSDHMSESKGYPHPTSASEALRELDPGHEVRTMTLTVHGNGTLRVHIRRLAGATYYSGDFDLFEDMVLNRLAAAGSRRFELLTGRGREDGEPSPLPVVVRLDTDYFAERANTNRLVERLENYRQGEVAVLHRNPYLHVALADYTDGSNYDVFVTDDDAIVVYGGYRASVGSLARLTEYLSEEFAAQEVTELPTSKPVSLEELFSVG